METRLHLEILPQPNDFTCGPTCLHAVYNYHGNEISLNQVIKQVHYLDNGGTLAVLLGLDALKQGFKATIYTYNLHIFDPSWFKLKKKQLREKLRQQLEVKHSPRLAMATHAYIEFLEHDGKLKQKDLSPGLIRKFLRKEIPVLTGLNASYLYGCKRERDEGDKMIYDDIGGYSAGHFVVLCGYDKLKKTVLVADPLHTNPAFNNQYYEVKLERLINAILLGIVTYDANLLIIEERGKKSI